MKLSIPRDKALLKRVTDTTLEVGTITSEKRYVHDQRANLLGDTPQTLPAAMQYVRMRMT